LAEGATPPGTKEEVREEVVSKGMRVCIQSVAEAQKERASALLGGFGDATARTPPHASEESFADARAAAGGVDDELLGHELAGNA
jgi:hypothetical protein